MVKTRKTKGNSKNKTNRKNTMKGHMHRRNNGCNFIGCKIDDWANLFHKTNLYTTRMIRGSEIKHNYSIRKGLSQHPM